MQKIIFINLVNISTILNCFEIFWPPWMFCDKRSCAQLKIFGCQHLQPAAWNPTQQAFASLLASLDLHWILDHRDERGGGGSDPPKRVLGQAARKGQTGKTQDMLEKPLIHLTTDSFQQLGHSQKEYEKCVITFSVKNQVRYRGNLGRFLEIKVGTENYDSSF